MLKSKMIAGNGLSYNEYLSKIFTNKKIMPSNLDGTNYAYTNPLLVPLVLKQ